MLKNRNDRSGTPVSSCHRILEGKKQYSNEIRGYNYNFIYLFGSGVAKSNILIRFL